MYAPVVTFLLVTSTLGQNSGSYRYGAIKKDEVEYQQQAFKQWWGDDLVLNLDDLPTEGQVPDFRVPYSGHDYPDRAGGTMNALSKYDRAFHGGRPRATEYERMDVSAHRNGRSDEPARGLFGRIRMGRNRVPGWYGHCNGWTAAAIRHAEPQKSVVRNGVVFTPADIKGLLAELYMYSESEFLGGVDPAINAGTLHLTLTNWLGRGSHPVGMETAVGEVVINFPIYSYKAVIREVSSREAEVRMTIRYALNTNRELDKGPAGYNRQMHFHYALELNEEGQIRGGRFFGDSAQVDMLWTPLQPTQGGQEGNKRGNPHLDLKEVLAIWRESVPEDLRKQWLNVDPTEEDRILPKAEALVTTSDAADAHEIPPLAPAATPTSPVAAIAAESPPAVAAEASAANSSASESGSTAAETSPTTTVADPAPPQ